MNAEYLLDAIGLLDDDLIREAENDTVQKRRPAYRAWVGWAACLAVVIALGYGVAHWHIDNVNSSSGGAPTPSASNGAGSNVNNEASGGSNAPGSADSSLSAPPSGEPASPGEGDFYAAIMVDGVVYWSTDTPIPGEVEEGTIRTVTSYTDSQPEEDGQTNFDRGLTTRYAMTDLGLVVLIDREWILFDSVPPWER